MKNHSSLIPTRHIIIGLTAIALWLAACEAAPTATPAPVVVVLPTATATATATPTNTPIPTPTATPSATPTPSPQLSRLTGGGCCTQPFWSPDSKQVMFIDKPDDKAPTGIYGVDVGAPSAPKLMTERIAFYTRDLQYAISLDTTYTTIEHLADGDQWRLRTGGRNVLLSPDGTRAVWTETPQFGAFEDRVTNVMIASRDGEARRLTSALRGGASAWLGGNRLLMTTRLSRASQEVTLYTLSLDDGGTKALVKSEHLRTILSSPNGEWIAYTIVFDKDVTQNGLWLIRADGSDRRKLDFFGALQWRDGHRLIYVPLDAMAGAHAFYEYDAATGRQRRLTNPQTGPFKIANGDWAVSPDGRKIVFVEAKDLNLWMWTFYD